MTKRRFTAAIAATMLLACSDDEPTSVTSTGNSAGTSGQAGAAGSAGAGTSGQAGAGGDAGAGGEAGAGADGGTSGGAGAGAGGGAGGAGEAGAAGTAGGEAAGTGGAGGDPGDGFTQEELAKIALLSPLPAPPPDTTNAYLGDPMAAELGQMLFHESDYSGALAVGDDGSNGGLGAVGETGKVSCKSCHGGATLDDQRSKPNNVSLGVDFGSRNALDIINSAYYTWTNWGGRFDSQWSLPLAVAENSKIMKSTRLQVAHLLWSKYRGEYDAVFPVPLDVALDPAAADAARFPASGKPKASADPDGPWEGMTAADQTLINTIYANYGKALQAYMRQFISGDSAFDKYVAGDKVALDEAQKRGLKLFVGKAGCVQCHSGPAFSDNQFHAIGVPQVGPHVPAADLGRYTDVVPLLSSPFNTSSSFSDDKATGKLDGLAQSDSMKGQFRTKILRNVARSPSYMHSGQFSTLEEVISFYNAGGTEILDVSKDPLMKPLGLSSDEQSDLVSFLKALDGTPVSADLLVDTSK